MKKTSASMSTFLRRPAMFALAALLSAAACRDLDVENPNEPDARRALSDPGGVQSIAGGTFRTWFNTHQSMLAAGPLVTMADSYTASWNNFNMRLYSSEPRSEWKNDPAEAARTSVEHYWYGYYSALSSSNDVLAAIRKNNLVINGAANTKMVETAAQLMQGMTTGELALNYDSAFVVDENSDLAALQFVGRSAVRDAAVKELEAAAALADANSFSTPADWTNGTAYTSNQIARLARTYAARVLAYYARNAAENGQTTWAKVATLAAGGISSGAGFDFQFKGDANIYYDEIKAWSNDITTMRMDTRVAKLLDPSTQQSPWPSPNGNPPPNSPDKRLGNGTNGTDFRWDGAAIFRAARGQYHQSNIGHIRYEYASFNDPAGSGGGIGTVPVISRAENDLLWAEGLIRGNGSLAKAADLINNTRVNRGGLPAASASDGTAGLLVKLQYEQDVELPGLGAVPYFNRRRIDGLLALTPHHMPVPAKELQVLQKPLYTYGGTVAPVQ